MPAVHHGRRRARAAVEAPWLVTFSDLLALLLTFMILLFATQELEKGRWESLVESLAQSLRPRPQPTDVPATVELGVESRALPPGLDLGYLDTLLREKMAADPALGDLVVHRLDDRIVIALPADFLFPPGTAGLRDEGRRAVHRLAGLFANLSNRIDVVGHSDPNPVRNDRFASNWELSVSRAVSVAKELRLAGYRAPVMALGYGDSRFADIPSTLAADRRQALARRVDVIVRPTEKDRK